MIRVRDRSIVMASDSVSLMKLLRSPYSVRVILGLGVQFDPNDVLTITSNVNLNLYNPNQPNKKKARGNASQTHLAP